MEVFSATRGGTDEVPAPEGLPSGSEQELGWLRGAVDTMTSGMIVVQADGAIVFSNAAAQRMYHLDGESLKGRPSYDPGQTCFHPDGSEMIPAEMPVPRCLRTGEPVIDAVVGTDSAWNGLVWHRNNARPIREGRRTVGAVLVFEDVTETMAIRHELVRSEEHLSQARRAGRVGLWEWNTDEHVVWHDENFERIIDRPFHGSVWGWMDMVDPRDVDEVRSALTRLAPGHPVDITYRDRGEGSATRWIAFHAEVVAVDSDGRSSRVAGSIADVTEAQAASNHLRTLLDAMADGYYTLDPSWRFGFVNRRASEMLQRTELVGRNVWEEFPGVDDTLREAYERAMGGQPAQLETYYAPLRAWFEVRAYPMDSGIAVHFRDITERREQDCERDRLLAETADAHARLAHTALHDDLTGLPNRAALLAWLPERLGGVGGGAHVGLLYLDLDRFKLVNDTYGHTTGDLLLVEAARRLTASVRPGDMVARLGGDEFLVAVADATAEEVSAVAERVVRAFREPFDIDGRQMVVTTSVGLSLSGVGATAESMVRDADAALYRAKDAGRDQVALYDESLRAAAWRRLGTETDLRVALARPASSIRAVYQPIYGLASGSVVAAEALARWNHPRRGAIDPAEFIPIAEETGLVVDLGWTILDATSRALPELATVFEPGRGRVWVNVAPRQLDEPNFAEDLLDWARERQVLGRLGIEITESALSRNSNGSEDTLRRITEGGVAIAIDDFGTGYSSLSRLARFPVDLLKIDRSFVRDLESPTGRGIVASIVALAHSIGAEVCAEGVEHGWQLTALTELGIDSVSGYHLCRPEALDRFADAARAGRQLVAVATDPLTGTP